MSIVFEDRQSTYPNRCLVTPQNGNPYYAVIERADEPVVVGTPLNADTFNGLAAEIKESVHAESKDYPGCYYRVVDGEMEWINPPMLEGVEYRTTERWLGYPVYVKQVTLGLKEVEETARVEIARPGIVDEILSLNGSVTDVDWFIWFPSPFMDTGGPVVSVWVETEYGGDIGTAVLSVKTLNQRLRDGWGTFLVRYTKY